MRFFSALSALSALSAFSALSASPAPAAQSYWQQEVRYDIKAKLDESRFELAGTERITYVNHSPDSLYSFSLHLYLNAFRPGSRWSDADSVERRRRFNDLKDPDFAYNHVRDVRIMGRPVEAIYPFAPDSTIVRFILPAALAPGDSMTVEMAWDARPSTTPRRQGRRGRAYDFAQWYPKVVVYDKYGWNEHPLYPGGEFYGEFATFLVNLDLPADEVMGATGVPLCGDPGWEQANQVPDRPVEYQRDFYPGAPRYAAKGLDCVAGDKATGDDATTSLGAGRKRLVWFAENAHHFAMSMNPDYRYEGGHWGDVAVHVLYQPGDSTSWGRGVAVQRTAKALEWLDGVFGKFAWPQISNVHRIEGGGTEFPMMIHDGSAGQGLIVHELGHNYVMGILANNEWREGWMDEGFTSFQNTLFDEAQGSFGGAAGDEAFITGMDLDGTSEPASLISEDYRDFTSYNIAIYTRGELFFHQLRYLVGDETMRRILREYYDRWKLKHVDEEAFREVAEEVSGRDLKGFFAEGLHGTELVDYAVGRVVTSRPTAEPSSDSWSTRVEVVRKSPGHRPVEVWVIGASDTAAARSEGLAEREWVTVTTRSKPKEILLDPRVDTHDWNMLDNRKKLGFQLFGSRPVDNYLDTWFSTPVHRDRLSNGVLPAVWYNDAGGITLGLRSRSDYFGRFEQNQILLSGSTGWATDEEVKDIDEFVRLRNPVWLRSPGMNQTLEVFNVEGRYGAMLSVERVIKPHLGFGPTRKVGLTLRGVVPDDTRYLVPGEYEDVGTGEFELSAGVTDRRGTWLLGAQGTAGAGLVFSDNGLTAASGRSDLAPYFGRATLTGTAERALGLHGRFRLRGYAGVSASGAGATAKQRQIYLAGADPLERLTNPFLRSRGALLLRPDVYYHMAGGAGLRGFDPTLSASGVVAANLELERTVVTRNQARLFRRVALAGFGDGGEFFADEATALTDRNGFLGDAGLGLRAEHRIGGTSFVTRVDFPLYVSRASLAQDRHPGSDQFGFRWQFSFEAAW